MILKEDVSKLIGKPFEQYKDGYAWGCLAPMYEILPETLPYRYNVLDWENMLEHFQKECVEISLDEVRYGDIIIVKPPILPFHLLVYLGDNKVLHCSKTSATEIISLDKFKGRIKGVFRYSGNSSSGLDSCRFNSSIYSSRFKATE